MSKNAFDTDFHELLSPAYFALKLHNYVNIVKILTELKIVYLIKLL